MQKHLLWYPWVCIAMAVGTVVCIALLIHMLISRQPEPEAMSSGVYFVREAVRHAAL